MKKHGSVIDPQIKFYAYFFVAENIQPFNCYARAFGCASKDFINTSLKYFYYWYLFPSDRIPSLMRLTVVPATGTSKDDFSVSMLATRGWIAVQKIDKCIIWDPQKAQPTQRVARALISCATCWPGELIDVVYHCVQTMSKGVHDSIVQNCVSRDVMWGHRNNNASIFYVYVYVYVKTRWIISLVMTLPSRCSFYRQKHFLLVLSGSLILNIFAGWPSCDCFIKSTLFIGCYC